MEHIAFYFAVTVFLFPREHLPLVSCYIDNNIPKSSLVSFNNVTVGGIHIVMIKSCLLFVHIIQQKYKYFICWIDALKKFWLNFLEGKQAKIPRTLFSHKKCGLGHSGRADVLWFSLGFSFLGQCFFWLLRRFCMPGLGSWRVPLQKHFSLFTEL